MKSTAFAALAAALMITGCDGRLPHHEKAKRVKVEEATVPEEAPPVVAATPSPAATPHVDLSRYVGKYPFDLVDGKRFRDLPVVHAAIEAAVSDPAIRHWVISNKSGPTTPIALKDGLLLSSGCEVDFCGPHNWTLVMRPDASDPQLCYTDLSGIRWFAGGKLLARKDPCPSGDG